MGDIPCRLSHLISLDPASRTYRLEFFLTSSERVNVNLKRGEPFPSGSTPSVPKLCPSLCPNYQKPIAPKRTHQP